MQILIALVVALAAFAAAPALAADPVATADVAKPHKRNCSYFNNIWLFGDPTDCPGDETVPKCDDPRVVNRAKKFVRRADDVYLAVELEELSLIREQPQPFARPSPLVRRYCAARARLSNNEITEAYYFLEEDSGFVGIPWKIYVCLLGKDDWRVYDGRCRIARPAVLN